MAEPKRWNEGDGSGSGLIALLAGLFEEKCGNRPVDDLQHREEHVGMDGKEAAQGNRKRQHPQAHRHLWDDMVNQMGSGLMHAPCAARGADDASSAAISASWFALVGTPYAARLRDHLLFLEEVNEGPYRVDHMLTQLDQALGLNMNAGKRTAEPRVPSPLAAAPS